MDQPLAIPPGDLVVHERAATGALDAHDPAAPLDRIQAIAKVESEAHRRIQTERLGAAQQHAAAADLDGVATQYRVILLADQDDRLGRAFRPGARVPELGRGRPRGLP